MEVIRILAFSARLNLFVDVLCHAVKEQLSNSEGTLDRKLQQCSKPKHVTR